MAMAHQGGAPLGGPPLRQRLLKSPLAIIVGPQLMGMSLTNLRFQIGIELGMNWTHEIKF